MDDLDVPVRTKSEIARIGACACHEVRRNNPDGYGWSTTPEKNKVRVEKAKKTRKARGVPLCGFTIWHQNASEEQVLDAYYKGRETLKKQGYGGRKSKSEESYYNKLVKLFGEDDIIREYREERYPFNCDFYIKSKDLFIEFQGHQSHGIEPYDENNIEHLKLINESHCDMTTFTTRDPHKLDVAKQNNITLILVYPRHKNWIVQNGKLQVLESSDF